MELQETFADRLDELCPLHHFFVNEKSEELAIRFRKRLMTARDQFVADLLIIFDNAVMHEHDMPNAMRMSILRGGFTMRCPTSMANATERVREFFCVTVEQSLYV